MTETMISTSQGQTFSREQMESKSSLVQSILQGCYARNEAAQCLCRPGGVQMKIVKKRNVYYLSSYPGQSRHHAFSCPYYSQDPRATGSSEYSNEALKASIDKSRVVICGSSSTPGDYLSLGALMDHVWERSSLNYWSSAEEGKRNTTSVTSILKSTIQSISVGIQEINGPKAVLLQIANYEDNGLKPQSSIIIFRVKRIIKSQTGTGIVPYFAPDTAVWLNNCQPLGISEDDLLRQPDRQIWVIADAVYKGKKNFTVSRYNLKMFNSRFLPINLPTLENQLQELIDSNREFQVCLHYDRVKTDVYPAAVLCDGPCENTFIYLQK